MPYKNKEDQLASQRRWYKRNKQKEIDRTKKQRQEKRFFLNNIKKTLKCELCNENHLACLDFHHINPDEKKFTLGESVNRNFSKEKILFEISKCKILCANCHRKIHFKE